MRIWIFIVSLLLPLFCGTATGVTSPPGDVRRDALSQPASEQSAWDHLPNKEMLLTSAQSLIGIGDESSATSTVRTQHGGNTHQIAKSPFRYIRDGKVTDIRRHPFFKVVVRQLSGVFSTDRYLFSVRRLRI